MSEYDLYATFEKQTAQLYKFSNFALTPSRLNNSNKTRHGLYYKLLISNVIFRYDFGGGKYIIVPKELMRLLRQVCVKATLDELLIDFEISDITGSYSNARAIRRKFSNLYSDHKIEQIFYVSKIE